MKQYLQVIACLFILILFLTLFFYSGDIFGFSYPLSYHALNESYNNMNMLNSKYQQSQREYEKLSIDYTNLLQVKNEIETISGGTDWGFHLPSMLVLLEQNAGYFNLDILIDAAKINEGDRNGDICIYNIPVTLTGTYESVRDYLGFLGSVDFIFVSNVEVKPLDESISASVSLEILSMDKYAHDSGRLPEHENDRNEYTEDGEKWPEEHW